MRSLRVGMIGWLHGCIAAFQFLTRLPIPVRIDYTQQVFRRSVVFYPMAGAVIGLIVAAAGAALDGVFPALPLSVILLVLWIGLTGGLHLDGLMDTADGILSHRSREQMLEIMKDSRVGAMGVIVCVLHLMLKVSLLYTLLDKGIWIAAIPLLMLATIWSRWFMVAAIYGWPYARREAGMGSLVQGVSVRHLAASTWIGALLSIAVLYIGGGRQLVTFYGWDSLSMLVGIILGALVIGIGTAAYLNHKLGGLTGDTYGAINELIEVGLLLAVTAIL
jgi:adenosylcobinamide-GDP ribazoletransferase